MGTLDELWTQMERMQVALRELAAEGDPWAEPLRKIDVQLRDEYGVIAERAEALDGVLGTLLDLLAARDYLTWAREHRPPSYLERYLSEYKVRKNDQNEDPPATQPINETAGQSMFLG